MPSIDAMKSQGQDKSSEKEYYDRLFKKRRRFDQFQNEIYEGLAKAARAGTDGTRALDLGCGAGTQSLYLIKEGFSVIAVDLSEEATKLTEAVVHDAGHSIEVLTADAEALPIPDASIDACVCGLLLHHFRSLDGVAAELQRVVRPGGIVVANDANAHNPFAWLFFNVVHRLRPLKGLTPNQRALTSHEIKEVFSRFGFGNFSFKSETSDLKREWLGDSIGSTLNFYTRAAVLSISRIVLPQICHGNMLNSVFYRLPTSQDASSSSPTARQSDTTPQQTIENAE